MKDINWYKEQMIMAMNEDGNSDGLNYYIVLALVEIRDVLIKINEDIDDSI